MRRNAEVDARRQRMLDCAEKGVSLSDLQEVQTDEVKIEDGANIGINCSLDARLSRRKMMRVFSLPAVRYEFQTSGLVLCLADEAANHYRRLGTFLATASSLKGRDIFAGLVISVLFRSIRLVPPALSSLSFVFLGSTFYYQCIAIHMFSG